MRVIGVRRVCAFSMALVVGLGLVSLVALPARACSCMLPDPYRGLAEADGAFVGALTATDRGIPVDNTGTLIDYAFDVEAAIKGEIGDTIVVKSAADGAACGFEMPIGDRVGILLRQSGSEWHGDLCWTFDADILLAASQGPPEPVPGSLPHVIVSAYLGSAGLVALDQDGQVVGYGPGRPTWLIESCPDDATFIGTGDGPNVRIWSFADLAQVDEIRLGSVASGGFYSLVCTGRGDFYALSATEQVSDLPQMMLSHVTDGDIQVVSEKVESIVDTEDGLLAIGTDGVINRIDIDSGSLTPITGTVGDMHGKLAYQTQSPDGRYLALSTADWTQEALAAGLIVADLETGESVDITTDCDVYPAWLDESRLVISDCVSEGFLAYTPRLELLGPSEGPPSYGYASAAKDETGAVYVPAETGIDVIRPGAETPERWAMLATYPNQIMVVPPAARDAWVGSDFVPAAPVELSPPAPPATVEPIDGNTIVPISVDETTSTSTWLVALALIAVSAVIWLIVRNPRPPAGASGR